MKNVMVDLETLGTSPNSVILSIGAVSFDKEIQKEFYEKIDLKSCIDKGLKIDPNTFLWWMQQNEDARKEIYEDADNFPDLIPVLYEFYSWVTNHDEVKIWGNGSDFDNVILANAFLACRLRVPWKFWNNRCYRTVKNLYPHIKKEEIGTKHNALNDARNQALHLIKILELIK